MAMMISDHHGWAGMSISCPDRAQDGEDDRDDARPGLTGEEGAGGQRAGGRR